MQYKTPWEHNISKHIKVEVRGGGGKMFIKEERFRPMSAVTDVNFRVVGDCGIYNYPQPMGQAREIQVEKGNRQIGTKY